jgi:hypothetical protein
LLALHYGKLSDTALQGIKDQNYPSKGLKGATVPGIDPAVTGFTEYCMDAVLSNLGHAGGIGMKEGIIKSADDARSERVAKLEADGAKQDDIDWEKKHRMSDYLEAAEQEGYAEELESDKVSRSVCRRSIVHDINADPWGPTDPFRFKNEKGNLLLDFFKPSPHARVLDALAGARVGIYMFGAAVAKTHSASILVEKLKDGPLTPESSEYNIFWNDQYNDGKKKWMDAIVEVEKEVPDPKDPSKTLKVKEQEKKRVEVDVGDGVHGNKGEVHTLPKSEIPEGTLGKRVSGKGREAEFVKKIFYNGQHSAPSSDKFWSKNSKYTEKHYNARAKQTPTEQQEIEKAAAKQRCSNVHGIDLWLITPARPKP